MFIIFPSLKLNGIINEDLALNLFSETWGLLFTLLFFVVIIELKDFFEWKPVRARIMRRIGNQLFDIIWDIDMLIDAENDSTMEGIENVDFNKLTKKKLDALVQGNFKVTLQFGDQVITTKLSQKYEAREAVINNIISRYGKYLLSEIHSSLMDIEEYLGQVSFELGVKPLVIKNYKGEKLPELLKKIGLEIERLRKNGIDIGSKVFL